MGVTLVVQVVLQGFFCPCCRPRYRYQPLHNVDGDVRKSKFTMAMLNGGWAQLEGCDSDDSCVRKHSWTDAVAANGQTYVSAAAAAILRLLFWHWSQPAIFFVVLYCSWDQLDSPKQILGSAVAAREVGYVLATFLCLWVNPAFLIVDVCASVRDNTSQFGGTNAGLAFLAMYTLTPEKVVLMAALGQGGLATKDGGCTSAGVATIVLMLDLCSVGALVEALTWPHGLPDALAVGYVATTAGLTVLACCSLEGRAQAEWKWRDDENVVMAAIQQNQPTLEHASPRLQNAKEVVMAAIQQKEPALEHASARLQDDKEVVMAAVKQRGQALRHASTRLQNDKEVVMAAVQQQGQALEHASTTLKNNKEVVLAAVQMHGFALEHASSRLKNSRDVVVAAIKQEPYVAWYASNQLLKNDKEVLIAAVHQRPAKALEQASAKLKDDKEVVMTAVREYGWALKHASARLQDNKEVVTTAVRSYGQALEYASARLQEDKTFVSQFRASSRFLDVSIEDL